MVLRFIPDNAMGEQVTRRFGQPIKIERDPKCRSTYAEGTRQLSWIEIDAYTLSGTSG